MERVVEESFRAWDPIGKSSVRLFLRIVRIKSLRDCKVSEDRIMEY